MEARFQWSLKNLKIKCLLVACLTILTGTTQGQLFVATHGTISGFSGVGEYTTSGETVNTSVISGAGSPVALAIGGNDLFVEVAGTYPTVDIGEYTTSGATVNASLFIFGGPVAMAVNGDDLFLASGNNIGEYTTSGATVNASLIPGADGTGGLAVVGNDLFVEGLSNGTIGEYTTSGETVDASLISGLRHPFGLAIAGDNLFVLDNGDGTTGYRIGEYTLSGATVNASLITGLSAPHSLAVVGDDLFVASDAFGGSISEYTTSGVMVNASLITFSPFTEPVAIVAVPEPASWVLDGFGLYLLSHYLLVKRERQKLKEHGITDNLIQTSNLE